jgi:type I restriction enzyme S subunit
MVPTETRDPARNGSPCFRYVDIASVSNRSFSIIEAREIASTEAPSRARKVIRDRDVIVATTRPYLINVAQVPSELDNEICSTGFCVLRSAPEIDPEWAFYFSTSNLLIDQLTPKMRGATYPAVTDRDVLNAEIPLPPLSEQRKTLVRIKECMERIDEIDRLRSDTKLDSTSLRTAVFGDYLQALDHEEARVVPLGQVLDDVRYGTSLKASAVRVGVPVLRMGNIQGGRITSSDLKFLGLPAPELSKYKLSEGDILINRTNSLELVGKAGLFTGLVGDWVFASYLVRLRVNRSLVMPEYVNAVINSRIGRDFVLRTARRAIGMVNINAQEIKRLPLPLPSMEIQASVVERIQQSEVLIRQLTSELNTMVASPLRASMLRKAFAGELNAQ